MSTIYIYDKNYYMMARYTLNSFAMPCDRERFLYGWMKRTSICLLPERRVDPRKTHALCLCVAVHKRARTCISLTRYQTTTICTTRRNVERSQVKMIDIWMNHVDIYIGENANEWTRQMLRNASARFGGLQDLVVIADNAPCHAKYVISDITL